MRAIPPGARPIRNRAARGWSARLHRGVDAAFEFPVEAERARIGKGQDLRHDHAGDAARRVEPEIAVVDAAPAQRAGAAPVRLLLHVDHAAEPPSELAAGEEV